VKAEIEDRSKREFPGNMVSGLNGFSPVTLARSLYEQGFRILGIEVDADGVQKVITTNGVVAYTWGGIEDDPRVFLGRQGSPLTSKY